jgi:hypothetical protein
VGRNQINYRGKQLLPTARLRSLGIRQPPKQNYIFVTAVQDNGQKQLIDQMMVDGSRLPLLYNYWLVYSRPMMSATQYQQEVTPWGN